MIGAKQGENIKESEGRIEFFVEYAKLKQKT